MDNRNLIKTGDALLFSGNSPIGFLLKTFVSSQWNHGGIAVRFIEKDGKKEISLTEEGKLYIFETNTGARLDPIFNREIVGAGFSDADWVFSKYNKIALRKLKDIFRTEALAKLTLDFADKYYGNKFPGSTLPFLGVWLGVELTSKGDSEEMFCSELMAYYYIHSVGAQYEKITGLSVTLSSLFGDKSPNSENMFTPGHYSSDGTPGASIFDGDEILIYESHADLIYVTLQPFIIILVIMLILWMLLPQ